MTRLRTIPKAVAELKAKDPNTSVSNHALRRWILDGHIPCIKVGKNYVVSMDAIETFMSKAEF